MKKSHLNLEFAEKSAKTANKKEIFAMWYKDKHWWQAAAERAIRSIAQGLLVGIGECAVIQAVNWKLALGTGALMGVVSILTSVAFGLPEYKEGQSGSD